MVPKTNLFKGDRVKLSPKYVSSMRIQSPHAPVIRWENRVGTIVSDTLDPDPRVDTIVVWWDGNKPPDLDNLRYDRGYLPEELMLYEEDDDVDTAVHHTSESISPVEGPEVDARDPLVRKAEVRPRV